MPARNSKRYCKMNTKPDDTTLALWLDDELEGEDLARMEAWAADQPEQLAAREEIRRWRAMIGACIPASEEPPAAEFFNERIQHAIRETRHEPAARTASLQIRWQRLWMPLSACAGMALAFWLGMTTPRSQEQAPLTATSAVPNLMPSIYTPESGVIAESFDSGVATVIVLSGVGAIPDFVDFAETVSGSKAWHPIESTAGLEDPSKENP